MSQEHEKLARAYYELGQIQAAGFRDAMNGESKTASNEGSAVANRIRERFGIKTAEDEEMSRTQRMKQKAQEGYGKAKQKAQEGYGKAKQKAQEGYGAAKEKAKGGYGAVKNNPGRAAAAAAGTIGAAGGLYGLSKTDTGKAIGMMGRGAKNHAKNVASTAKGELRGLAGAAKGGLGRMKDKGVDAARNAGRVAKSPRAGGRLGRMKGKNMVDAVRQKLSR